MTAAPAGSDRLQLQVLLLDVERLHRSGWLLALPELMLTFLDQLPLLAAKFPRCELLADAFGLFLSYLLLGSGLQLPPFVSLPFLSSFVSFLPFPSLSPVVSLPA